MAYFLKKAHLKGRTYLSIVESFYSPEKHGAAHRTYKSLKSVEFWKSQGNIDDPIAYFQKEVDRLNKENSDKNTRKISDRTPEMFIGYFPFRSIMRKMDIKKYVDYFNKNNQFSYDLYELMSSLIYARLVNPCSKLRTFQEVIPQLREEVHYSYDQLLEGIEFLGNDYEKFIEIFNEQVGTVYNISTDKTYFDCTNFYFEIDREDDFRKKGPSKENRKDPIVGLGLLLDANQIPIGMKMYPGNQSEKPVMRDVIKDLKNRNQITGKTIHVADKGLNCAQNIAFSKENKRRLSPTSLDQMEKLFLSTLREIKKDFPRLDHAMFPVDPRLEQEMLRGMFQLLKTIEVGQLHPMHFCLPPDIA